MPDLDPSKRRYSIDEACAVLEIQKAQFREYVRTGIYPEGRKRGKKLLYWTPEDIQGMFWVEENLERFVWFRLPGAMPQEQKTDEDDE